jgi:1-acyl-sn-glycerol-3-phosphate acyltransferase
MRKPIAKFIFRLWGWKVVGQMPKARKAILVVAPHTSSWDFLLGVFSRAILGIQIKYIGKESLFKPPFGWLFRWLGGYPVNRVQRKDTVKFIVELFNRHDDFLLALSPEGTREYAPQLKTGFYAISQGAQVPMVLVGFDYAKKEVQINPPFYATGDREADFEHILGYFRTVKGRFPEQGIR